MEKGGGKVNPALADARGSRYQRSVKKDEPDRAERLAEALRANLRRRKVQSREQATAPLPEPPPAPIGAPNAGNAP